MQKGGVELKGARQDTAGPALASEPRRPEPARAG
jgi:hypothetical protein